MRSKLVIILLSSSLAIAGCSSSTTPPPANGSQTAVEVAQPSSSTANQPSSPAPAAAVAVKPKVDACALLSSKEIESVQGEAIKETKLTGQSTGGFSVSQCFFTLPNFTNSISLLVAQKGGGSGANDPKEFWWGSLRIEGRCLHSHQHWWRGGSGYEDKEIESSGSESAGKVVSRLRKKERLNALNRWRRKVCRPNGVIC